MMLPSRHSRGKEAAMESTRLVISVLCVSLTLIAACGGSEEQQTNNCAQAFGHVPNFILCAAEATSCTFYWKSDTTDDTAGDLVERSCDELCPPGGLTMCLDAWEEARENSCNKGDPFTCGEKASDAICKCGFSPDS